MAADSGKTQTIFLKQKINPKRMRLSSIIIVLFNFTLVFGQFNVTSYGAKADGVTLDTKAIQSAVDAAAANGGVVFFPTGNYLTGTIYLKDNVSIEVSKGATIWGSPNLADYPMNTPEIIFWGKEWAQFALFYAEKKSNISIYGGGTINGQGEKFKLLTKEKGNPNRYRERPYVFYFVECKNLKIDDLQLRNSAFWMQHYLACNNVRISNLNVYNQCNKNNDMMDIDGCNDVIITNCIGDVDDDGITLKSTSGRITKDIVISDCVLSSHCNAIKMGTESHGGFKNITINNCVIKPSVSPTLIAGRKEGLGGVALEIVDGGVMDGINISNIVVNGTTTPLFVKLGNRARKYDPAMKTPSVGEIKNISISNFTANGGNEFSSSISGLPGYPVKNISLNNIRINSLGSTLISNPLKAVDEAETAYPEGDMFGELPAYGLFLRHIENLNVSNMQLQFEKNDVRPAIYADDVKGFSLSGLSAKTNDQEVSLLFLKNIKNIILESIRVIGTKKPVISILSNDINEISFDNKKNFLVKTIK